MPAFLLVLLLLQQTPCDSQVSMLEVRLATAQAEIQSCRARLNTIEPELTNTITELLQTKTRIVEVERRVVVESEQAKQTISALEASVRDKERTINLLLIELKRAKTWKRSFARVFGVKK